MENLENIIFKKVYKMPGWRTFILFGALKRYRYYFWTYEERRKINEKYHQDLMESNWIPVQYINIFESNDKKPFVTSFFRDNAKDYEYIQMIIWDIKYNLEHLNNIISFCLEFEEGTSKYISAADFFDKVSKYIEEQKRLKTISEPINLNDDWREIDYIEIKEPKPLSDEEIGRLERSFSVDYVPEWIDEENFEYDYKMKIKIHGFEVEFKESNFNLTVSEKMILKSQFTKIEDITLKNCVNLVNNYKLFVDEKKYKSFKKTIFKNSALFNSLFEDFAVEAIVESLKRFYSPSVYLSTRTRFAEDEEKEVFKKVLIELNETFNSYEMLCWLIDLLGYCDKKGFYYICMFTYIDLNFIIRQVLKGVPTTFCCFDPLFYGKWLDWEKGEPRAINDLDYDFVKVIQSLLAENFYGHLNSSMILEVLEIAKINRNFNVATKEIDKAIRKYKKDIKEGRRTF